jgi:hypothetical protein
MSFNQPQPLIRIAGTLVDTRVERWEARPATETRAAVEAGSYAEAAVLVASSAIGKTVVDTQSALTLRMDEAELRGYSVGEIVDLWCTVGSTYVPGRNGRRGYNQVVFRPVAVVEVEADAPASRGRQKAGV